MNINIIKNKINLLKGSKVKLKVYLGRNKYEYLTGNIENLHNNLFTVNTNLGVRSFTYSDVLIKNVIVNKI